MEFPRVGRVPTLPELFPSEEQHPPTPILDTLSRKKERRRDPNRPLDSWERYRALNDAMDEAYELDGPQQSRSALRAAGNGHSQRVRRHRGEPAGSRWRVRPQRAHRRRSAPRHLRR